MFRISRPTAARKNADRASIAAASGAPGSPAEPPVPPPAPLPRPAAPPARLPALLLLLILVAATLLAYLPAMRCGFIWDDDRFLTDNPLIKAPGGLRLFWLSTKPLDYFPLTSTTLWFEWRLWHMDPRGYHVLNILLHAASAVLIWRVLARLRIPGAWLAGLIFAVHPVCVESVAWITERKNTLPLPLFLASLLLYLKFDEEAESGKFGHSEIGRLGDSETGRSTTHPLSQSPNHPITQSPTLPLSKFPLYLLSLTVFLLALLAKTSVVMLPLVLLLCAWWRRGRVSRRDVLRALPFFFLAAALSGVTMWYQHYRAIGGETIRTDGLFGRAAVAGWAVWFYLCKALLPAGLCFVYPRFDAARALAPFLPAAMLAFGFLLLCRRHSHPGARASLFALGFFIAALLPVLGFVDIYFMKYSLVTDHWQYAALIAPVALAAAALRLPGRTASLRLALAAAVVFLFAALSWRQERIYRDSETLWRATARCNPRAWLAWNNLSPILVAKGEQIRRRGGDPESFYREAVRCCDRAIALHPAAESWTNRAEAVLDLGAPADIREAIAECRLAIRMDPTIAEPWNTLGNADCRLRRYDDAIKDFTQAIRWRPDLAAIRYNRGNAYFDSGRYEEAAEDYRQALRLQPDFPAASRSLAAALQRLQDRK